MPSVVNINDDDLLWRYLDLSYDSAYKNLALEEALARKTESGEFVPTVRFWTNVPAVVLGRFQDAELEVDLDLCESRRVQVARRFTGGGAVFHDEGTLNLTIITKPTHGLSLARLYQMNAQLILDSLDDLDLECSFSPPNSILVNGKKISGAAAALGARYTLWHASILISTNTRLLEEALAPSRHMFQTRFVRSQWKPVTTIVKELDGNVDAKKLRSHLVESFTSRTCAKLTSGALSKDEENALQDLLPKYSSMQWNLHGESF